VIHHISDGPLLTNGVSWTVLPEGASAYKDMSLRRITKACWNHFVTYHGQARWFLRGLYDMYVNVTNLMEFVSELEKRYDPMTEWVGRYGCHFFGIDYPHGSTGHFFSNLGVHRLVGNMGVFDRCPTRWGEDLCMRYVMDKLVIPFYEGCSTRFIITFPGSSKTLRSPIICPELHFFEEKSLVQLGPTAVSTAVAIHMHAMKMQVWTARLREAHGLSVVWAKKRSHGTPLFCVPGVVNGSTES
jgi:hypothetical protein